MPEHSPIPRRAGTFAMLLFLLALAILFAASLLLYVITRLRRSDAGTLSIPTSLWFSTALILASSLTIQLALRHIQRERQAPFRRSLIATLTLACAFVAVQAPSMARLLAMHHPVPGRPATDYGLVFVLILVHALHVLGGMIALGVVIRAAFLHRYDHESHRPVRHLAMYWHFLDGVWLTMFAVFLVIR
jgi:heme/copper-type cytochrome/quinol oxidase subunit 3